MVQRLSGEAVRDAYDRLRASVGGAFDTIVELTGPEHSESIRLAACKTIITEFPRYFDIIETEHRLRLLESFAAQDDEASRVSNKRRLTRLERTARERARARVEARRQPPRPDIHAVLTHDDPERLAGFFTTAVRAELVPSHIVPECVSRHAGQPCDACRHWQWVALRYFVNWHRRDLHHPDRDQSWREIYATKLFPEVAVPEILEVAIEIYDEELAAGLDGQREIRDILHDRAPTRSVT